MKQYLPNSVINVVRGLDSLASGICQNPLFASNLLNIMAPASLARVSSTFGIGCASLITLVLSGFRSTHTRHAPEVLGTTTIPAHQGAGSVISEMTPSLSILSSSSFTFHLKPSSQYDGRSYDATLHDVERVCATS